MRLTPEQRTEILERHLHDHGHADHERMDDAIADATAGNGPSEALGARIVARAWVIPSSAPACWPMPSGRWPSTSSRRSRSRCCRTRRRCTT
jgi:hypothetical protein